MTRDMREDTTMHVAKKMFQLFIAAGLLLLFGMPMIAVAGQADTSGHPGEAPVVASNGVADYGTLSGLAAAIGNDAILRFNAFFRPTPVTVTPFVTMDDNIHRPSLFGVILADQMLAMVNNETSSRFADNNDPAVGTQQLSGVLQEVDGYLRIHISGHNDRGEQRSYVVAVEMSEPLFRALHTYLTP